MKINAKLIGVVLGILLFVSLCVWIYTYFKTIDQLLDEAEKKEVIYQRKIQEQDSIIYYQQEIEQAILKELPSLSKQIKTLQNKKYEIIFNPENRDYWNGLSDSAKVDTLSNLVNRLHKHHNNYKKLLLSDTLRQPVSVPE